MNDITRAQRKIKAAARHLEEAQRLLDDARDLLPADRKQFVTQGILAVIDAGFRCRDAGKTFEEKYPEPKPPANIYERIEQQNNAELARTNGGA